MADNELAKALAASREAFDEERTARNKRDQEEQQALKQALSLSLSEASSESTAPPQSCAVAPPQQSATPAQLSTTQQAAPRMQRAEALTTFGLTDADLFFVKATDGSFATADVERAAARRHGSAAAARAEARKRSAGPSDAATTKRSAGANSTATKRSAARVPQRRRSARVEEEDAKHASAALDERVRVVAPPSDYVRVVAGPPGAGDYVLCVLQLALRVECNPPLLAAARGARRWLPADRRRRAALPDGAPRRLRAREPAASRRASPAAGACVAVLGEGAERLAALAAGARAVFCDDCPLEPYRSVVAALADCGRRVSAVDAACVVPASWTAPASALDRELLAGRECAYDDVTEALLADAGAVDRALDAVATCDRAVSRVTSMVGGSTFAKRRWASYKQRGLASYGKRRNDATSVNAVSRLSAHVHYGCIPVFLMARDAQAARADKFLDELLVFREMGYAFCGKHEAAIAADAYSTLPAWARTQLADHAADARRVVGPERLERGESGDVMWDAMQRCLIRHGELHNNLRMTWGKAFLRWAPTPRAAFDLAMRLSDASPDGADPNSSRASPGASAASTARRSRRRRRSRALRARPTSTHARIRDRCVALVSGAYPAPTI
ncbi:FAD dependent oxidoreductase [Aureococcus anophagefferens]|nr:FAD dependent oxidoreductase [Aureococcus anophagefferens]